MTRPSDVRRSAAILATGVLAAALGIVAALTMMPANAQGATMCPKQACHVPSGDCGLVDVPYYCLEFANGCKTTTCNVE